MSKFDAKITAELDTSKIEQQIDELNGKKIKFDVDTGDTVKEVQNVNKQIVTTRKSTQSFGDALKKSLNIVPAASLTAEAINSVRTAADKACDAIKDFDSAITDLRMATGGTYQEVFDLVKGYNQLGKVMGATTTEVSDSADAWLRQGHSVSETNALIKDSMILSKVAKLDSADSTEYLTSAMKGYKVAVEDVIGIVDKLTAVDLVSATDAGGLAEAMSKTAVSANYAGVEMEQLLGYLAAVGEVTQDSMSAIGNAFKTFFARYSDIKTGKLELVDEDGTIEVLSDVEQSLKNVGIDMRSTITDFDDFGEALIALDAKWDNLNSVQQSAIAKAFGGTRQKERFLDLMENFDSATSYMETAVNSAGTAMQKFGAYTDSIEAKMKTLQASFESLAVNTFSTELFGGIIEATTSLVTFLDKTNLLKSSLAGIAGAGAIKVFTMLASGIANVAVRMNEFNSALSMLKSSNIGESQMQKLIQLTSNLSNSQLQAVVSSKALSTEQRMAILTANGMSKAEAQATLTTMGLATAEGTAAKSTFTLSSAMKGLWQTLKANPLILVASLITGVISAFSAMSDAVEESARAAEENLSKLREQAQAATETRSSVKALIDQYKDLADACDGAWSADQANEVKSIQDQITDLVGDQASNLDLVNGKLDEELQKLLNIYSVVSKTELENAESAYLTSKQQYENGYQRERDLWGNSKEDDYLASWYIRRAYEEINDVAADVAQEWWGSQVGFDGVQWLGDIPTALEQIGSYEDGLERLYEWRSLLINATNEGFGDSQGNVYDTADALSYINSKITEFEDVIQDAEAAKDRFFEAKANTEVLDYLVQNEIDSQQDFLNYINSVLSNDSISKEYAQALINAMHSYFPSLEIPDSVKKSFIAERDALINEVANAIPKTDTDLLGGWLDNMTVSEYETFVAWWKDNANSEVVTQSLDGMMATFSEHLERVAIAANGVAGGIDSIIASTQNDLASTQSLIDGIASVQDVLASQSTGTSISLDVYGSEGLKDYTSALEYSNGTLQLNTEKVNELIEAKSKEQIAHNNANKAVAQSKYVQNAREINKLRKELLDLNDAESDTADQIKDKIDTLTQENEAIDSLCAQYTLMSASLREATGAYQHWLNAQNASQSGDMFDDTLNAINHIDDTLNNKSSDLYGRVGRTDYKAALDVIIPDTIDITDRNAVDAYLDEVAKLFMFDGDGKYAGLNLTAFIQKAVDKGLIVFDEASQSYILAGEMTMESFAYGMELALPLVQAMFGEMGEYGGQFDWLDYSDKTLGDLAVAAENAVNHLSPLADKAGESFNVNLDFESLDEGIDQLDYIDTQIANLQEAKTTLNLNSDQVAMANDAIQYCVLYKQSLEDPAILKVDTTQLQGDSAEAFALLQEFKNACNSLEVQQAVGADTTLAEQEVESLRQTIESSDNAYLVKLRTEGLDASDQQALNDQISAYSKQDLIISFGINDQAFADYIAQTEFDQTGTVTYTVNDDQVKQFAKDLPNLHRTIYYKGEYTGNHPESGTHELNGTAHAAGTAYSGGNWGTAPGGRTLVGELGREIVVNPHTGRWYTVGDNGAEFTNIPRGAIVFNHLQTEKLLKNGYVASRASALVSGTALLGGTAMAVKPGISQIALDDIGNTKGLYTYDERKTPCHAD